MRTKAAFRKRANTDVHRHDVLPGPLVSSLSFSFSSYRGANFFRTSTIIRTIHRRWIDLRVIRERDRRCLSGRVFLDDRKTRVIVNSAANNSTGICPGFSVERVRRVRETRRRIIVAISASCAKKKEKKIRAASKKKKKNKKTRFNALLAFGRFRAGLRSCNPRFARCASDNLIQGELVRSIWGFLDRRVINRFKPCFQRDFPPFTILQFCTGDKLSILFRARLP